jgi:hypothetical protein
MEKYIKQGIDDWQIAFEKAGWKNAIRGEYWPENDPTMSLEDACFSVLRYFALKFKMLMDQMFMIREVERY